MEFFSEYDYVVCNDTVESCAEQIRAIVQVEGYATKRHATVPTDYFKEV
jgi:guanylate kinase